MEKFKHKQEFNVFNLWNIKKANKDQMNIQTIKRTTLDQQHVFKNEVSHHRNPQSIRLDHSDMFSLQEFSHGRPNRFHPDIPDPSIIQEEDLNDDIDMALPSDENEQQENDSSETVSILKKSN